MPESLTDRESSTDVFREWIDSLPVSSDVAPHGSAGGMMREKAWIDKAIEPSKRAKAWLDEQTVADPSKREKRWLDEQTVADPSKREKRWLDEQTVADPSKREKPGSK
jgi:hypothetical protein